MKVVGRSGQVMDLPDGLARSLLRTGHVKVADAEKAEPEPEIEVSVVDYAVAERTTSPQAEPATIRRWAAEAGIECPPKGRIPKAVRDAYNEDHPS